MKPLRFNSYTLGYIAELIVIIYLLFKGYRILKHRYRCAVGEIDIVAYKNYQVIFIEVKVRKIYANACASITTNQQHRIKQTALYFLNKNPEYQRFDLRFDAVFLSFNRYLVQIKNCFI